MAAVVDTLQRPKPAAWLAQDFVALRAVKGSASPRNPRCAGHDGTVGWVGGGWCWVVVADVVCRCWCFVGVGGSVGLVSGSGDGWVVGVGRSAVGVGCGWFAGVAVGLFTATVDFDGTGRAVATRGQCTHQARTLHVVPCSLRSGKKTLLCRRLCWCCCARLQRLR